MTKLSRIAILIIPVFILAGTLVSAQNEGFSTAPSGLKYKFHKDVKDSKKANTGDMMYVHIIYMVNGETMYFDTHMNNDPVPTELRAPDYPGDIFEGLAMMTVGDSATFVVDAEQFFTRTARMQGLPETIKKGDMMHFNIAFINLVNRDDYIKEQARQMQEKEEMKVKKTQEEAAVMDKYLKDNNLKGQKQASGLVYIPVTEGTGAQAAAGKVVKVHYTGMFLDGSKFDSSLDRGDPIEFPLGANKVIKGWDEGIALMKQGGKAKLLIPFELGYGDRQTSVIPPYSTLVFDVELVEVK